MKKQNIIYLDIDGVLNSHLWYESIDISNIKEFYDQHIDTSKIEILNKLCKDTNSVIVISSSWRKGKTVKELQEILDSKGANFYIIDKTDKCCSGIRGVEIYNNWNKHEYIYNNYAILDDDSDMLLWQQNNFFQCDGYVGLTPTICFKIERFLNGKDNYEL